MSTGNNYSDTTTMPKPENIEPHKFAEGVSGNPNGRPKGSRNRSTIARRWLEVEEKIKNPISGQQEQLSQEDIATLALLKKARSGDVNAYKALMDSAYGSPNQQMDINANVGVKTLRMVKTYQADGTDGANAEANDSD
jgi:hypothetical protein